MRPPTLDELIDSAPFPSLEALIAHVAETFSPNERLTVTESAQLYTRIGSGSGRAVPWSLQKTPYIAEPQDILISLDYRGMIFVGPARTGKALALDTPIATPSGWSTMGELREGDQVFGSDGKPVSIIAATEVMRNHVCYRVRFSDGSEIVADAGHKWEVRDITVETRLRVRNGATRTAIGEDKDKAVKVLTTHQMFEKGVLQGNRGRKRYAIPVAKPLELPDVDLPIDPYVYGVWLGDGSKINCTITSAAADHEDMARCIEARGYRVRTYKPSRVHAAYTLAVMGPDGVFLDQYISSAGLEESDKHIPDIYLRASERQRRELFRGLCDTDGSVMGIAGRHLQFTTVCPRLADQVHELAISLGYKATHRVKKAWYTNKGKRVRTLCRDAHLIEFIVYDPSECFSLPRKAIRVLPDPGKRESQTGSRFIDSIEPVGSVPVRCITVDAEDHLFLAGRAMIPTHNSVMVLNWTTHTTMNDPDDMLAVHTDAKNGRKWSKGEFDRYLIASTAVRARQLTAKQYDNTYDKQFRSGMRFNLTFPTSSNLSAITVGKVFFMDYDRIDDDTQGEGNPYDLGATRTRTKGRFGMTAAESSPNPDKEMPDPKWTPSSPHAAPPAPGIFELYNRGDRRCWYWPCPHCGEYFEGRFEHLHGWEDKTDLAEATESVYMLCPSGNGCVIEPHEKERMNMRGIWVPDGGRVTPEGEIVPIDGMKIARSRIASFWLKGPAAGYFSWSELVEAYIIALRAYDETGDEGPLRKTVTTDQGMYYISKARLSDRNPDQLRERAEDWGSTKDNPTVPDGVRFIVTTVDTQGDGFVCQSTGFMPNGDAVVIDGWKLKSSNRLDADGKNLPVDPRAFAEDWDMLGDEVLGKTYELADGSGRRMRIKMASVDGYGQEGVTTQAYRFWQRLKARGDGSHRRFAIGKGEPRKDWPIAKSVMTEVGEGKKNALVRGAIPRIHFGSTLVKDTVANLMARRIAAEDHEDGGGKLRYPDWMPKWFYSQLTNEIRTPKGWVKIGSRRNEVFDLTSYAVGLVYRPMEGIEFPWPNIQFHRINWDKPPAWAAPWDENELVFSGVDAGPGDDVPGVPKKSSFAELAKKLA